MISMYNVLSVTKASLIPTASIIDITWMKVDIGYNKRVCLLTNNTDNIKRRYL